MESTHVAIEDGAHPLLVDSIIENILSAFSADEEYRIGLKTLLSCRKVCQKWKRLATIKIQSHAIISFKCKENEPTFSLSSYIDYLNSDSQLRCTKFSFDNVSFMNQDMADFLKIQGSQIHTLYLNFKEEETPNEELETQLDTKTFRELLTKCGSLKRLMIMKLPVSVIQQGFRLPKAIETLSTNIKNISIFDWQSKACVSFYEDLLRSAPNLQWLKISQIVVDHYDKTHTNGYGHLPRLISILPEIAPPMENHLRYVQKWKPIDLQNAMPLNQLSSLANLSFREFLIGPDGSQFRKFLEPLSKTLKHLHLHIVTRLVTPTTTTTITPISFPVMPILLQLTLNPDRFKRKLENHLHLIPIHHSEIFPKLKLAYFKTHKENFDSILSQKFEPHLTLDFLILHLSKESSLSEIMRTSHIFQKIRHLHIEKGSLVSYRLIFTSWSQLESLRLTYVHVKNDFQNRAQFLTLDCFLTGLTQDNCRLLKESKDILNFKCDSVFPSIANLKKLNRLSITLDTNSRQPFHEEMSNASVWALVKLHKLKFIELSIDIQINEDATSLLYKVFPNLVIKRHLN